MIHKKNGGLSSARNAGLAMAGGRYIGFVDSDDYVLPTMYEKLMDAVQKYQAQIVSCKYFSFKEESTPQICIDVYKRQELYSNAYVYVLPSDVEGMPLSLLEAMSYGNCCLVSDIKEITEVVEDKAVIFPKDVYKRQLCDERF